jgi:uncharacterized YccA/Bax inhibitor family protein
MRGSNPILNSSTFVNGVNVAAATDRMTVQGTINKTGLLVLLAMASATWSWHVAATDPDAAPGLLLLGLLGGLGAAFATIFAKRWAPATAPVYAVLEGLVVGAVSQMANTASKGIAVQAVSLTFAVLATMLVAYSTGIIRVTRRFITVVVAATGAIMLLYLVNLGLTLFTHTRLPMLSDASPLGIGFSLVVVAIAAANLAIDFSFIESASAAGAPRYMEWYGAFGVMVTLIWLYLEILRLLSRIRR